MTLQEITDILPAAGGVALCLMTIVQVTPIKVNPWSALARAIGNALMGDLKKQVSDLSVEIKRMSNELVELKKDPSVYCGVASTVHTIKHNLEKLEEVSRNRAAKEDEREAKNLRVRILSFEDDLLHGLNHSKEHYDQVLTDITDYNNYCQSHKNFKNEVAVTAIRHIEDVYRQRLADNSFLR